MSNLSVIIEERPTRIGNFLVGRLLPFREKRMVGPFIFIDHMGPATMNSGENIDIPPHPHIGLSTLTYLFEGSILHRDTLGMEVEIKPGEVNWMTAGKGIVHSERTPAHLRGSSQQMHGLQIWVALPRELEEMEPEFQHVDKAALPIWETEGIHYKLIAGEAFGRKSPVAVYSPLFLLEIRATVTQELNIGSQLFGEVGLYILEGSVSIEGNTYAPKQLLVTTQGTLCSFTLEAGSSIYIFGGTPFPEERFIYWNFVSSRRELIEQAKQRWLNQEFGQIAGEQGFVPLPQR